MINYCNTCALFNKIKSVCGLTGRPVSETADYCSEHTNELLICDICHLPMLPTGCFIQDSTHIYCEKCNQYLNSCQVCDKFQICPFETDPNPIPKVVVNTKQQGNMRMQVQERNVEREKMFCYECCCWNEEYGCMKMFNIGCNKKIVTNS